MAKSRVIGGFTDDELVAEIRRDTVQRQGANWARHESGDWDLAEQQCERELARLDPDAAMALCRLLASRFRTEPRPAGRR